MARPIKEGLDYFPHDTDAFNDEKIEVLRFRHGAMGYMFYFFHLERIYRSPNSELLVSDAETRQIFSRKLAITEQEYENILSTCIKYHCFDAERYTKEGVLTSNGIQKRASIVIDKRNRMRHLYEEKVSCAETRQKPSRNCAETIAESTQSKVKNSKEENSKEENSKEENSKEENSKEENSKEENMIPQTSLAFLWNAVCVSLPKVISLSSKRKKQEKLRLLERPVEKWKDIFIKLNNLEFCKGNNNTGWKATYDWIISNTDNSIKVMEGKYDGQIGRSKQPAVEKTGKPSKYANLECKEINTDDPGTTETV